MKVHKATKENRTFLIEEDLPDIGAYLRVYENGRDIRDHLQDSVDICKEYALEEYGVPLELWKEEFR